ncbi:MAG TPA: hypothetical protein VGB67_08895 [Fibrella sp.]|jgi:hypothetical protein
MPQQTTTTYAEYTNTGDTVENWLAGQKRFHMYSPGVDCEAEEAAFLALNISQQIAATTLIDPLTAGSQRVARTCTTTTPSTTIYAVANNSDFVPYSSDSTVPNPGTDTTNYGASRVVSSNNNLFQVGIEWQNGLARYKILNQPVISGNQKLFIYADGQIPMLSAPTAYVFKPGDTTRLYLVVAANTDLNNTPFNVKATADLYFGNAVTGAV